MTQKNSKKTIRSLTIAALALVMITGMAVPVQACEFLDNLMPWNWCKQDACAATTCAPLFTPAAAPCATACSPVASTYMTARYIPQTSYRTVYRTAPVTTCMPVNGCDPCSGCPTTTYRPVTGYQRVAQLVPYTTYRIAWQENRCYTSCYTPSTASCFSPCATTCSPCDSGCGTGDCYSGACGSSVTSSGCSSCSAPATTTVTTPSTYSNGSQQPQLPSGTQWDTKRPTEPKPTPVPDPAASYKNESFKVPQLVPAGRTAAKPVRLISYETRTATPSTTMNNVVDDTNEWRAR